MRVGFDFDKVFIDYPPLTPYFLIDFLYKGKSVFRKKIVKKTSLNYRFPGRLEQQLRIASHHPGLRNPIKINLDALKEISKDKKTKTYLVSSRFSFLKKRTDAIVKKYSLNKYFDGIYFNYDDNQPHLFKEQTIRKLKIESYIDDDLQLSLYLAKSIPDLKIFWVHDGQSTTMRLPTNITPIRNLQELKKYLPING